MKTLADKIKDLENAAAEQLKKDIEQLEKNERVVEARKDLKNKLAKELTDIKKQQDKEIKAFEDEYGAGSYLGFEPLPIKKKHFYSINEKAEIIYNLKDKNGKPKFKYIDGQVFGQKSETEPLKNIIPFKDEFGDKQTLTLSNYIEWCKDFNK